MDNLNKKYYDLGFDIGTNSIGWALIERGTKIKAAGSRIIPMDRESLDNFNAGKSGQTTSPCSERTTFRMTRRIKERSILRRERLHRVLNVLNFLPKHYADSIDFENKLGQFKNGIESKLAYVEGDFIFMESYQEMLAEFQKKHPSLLSQGKRLPYDWTIYYLRKKAIAKKITVEELAWLLLHFNQKRGYYQLRGEDAEENLSKREECFTLKVISVEDSGDRKGVDDIWYNITLENGWIYKRTSKVYLDWVGHVKDFIVTTSIDDQGNIKLDKDGKEKRNLRLPSPEDWTLVKKKTERNIIESNQTVGCYIYEALLNSPDKKIKGGLVKTIERKLYKAELIQILEKQKEFHPKLNDKEVYHKCILELYKSNDSYRHLISNRGFIYLFVSDIIFYQRPLKSKKSLIENCQYEYRQYIDKENEKQRVPLKCIARSNPLFQEFRLWQFVKNLKIYQREKTLNGKLVTDVDVTSEFLKDEYEIESLFRWLNERNEIKQEQLLKYPKFGLKKDFVKYRWNYVEDKTYPCNKTHHDIQVRLRKFVPLDSDLLSINNEQKLWHMLYSIEDKIELHTALTRYARKNKLSEEFVLLFEKFPPFEKKYGSYSEKAIKKMLPLMRLGSLWNEEAIDAKLKERIQNTLDGVVDDSISEKTRIFYSENKEIKGLKSISQFKGLSLSTICYLVYGRHSESVDSVKWRSPEDITAYLNTFKQHTLKNPIAEKIILETLRVARDIWQYHGKGVADFFSEIHVELGRELKNDAQTRMNMSAQMTKNELTNVRIKALLIELAEDGMTENVRPYSLSQQEILKIYEDGVLSSGVSVEGDIDKILKMKSPSKKDILRYKCWLEQKYRSPYTGAVIPLSRLFTTDYEIEHIIPQARYFDDSYNNKVICESAVNKKKRATLAYSFIVSNEGSIIDLGFGKSVKIFTSSEYEEFVKYHYKNNRRKLSNLLLDEIPDSFISRQLNDTRYISKVVKNLLSNIVRETGEDQVTSKNLISCNGQITDRLKREWGMNDIWNQIVSERFQRLNEKTSSQAYGYWDNINGMRVFRTAVPSKIEQGFNKKRIDHRHHAMDAIVIACTTRSHVNYLNNSHANKETIKYDLRANLCVKKRYDEAGSYIWQFIKPWSTFTQDAHAALDSTQITFKQNLRVINKTTNYYQKIVEGKKILVKQEKGDNWAIRKPLHKDTVLGLVNIRKKREVQLSVAIDNWQMIVDKNIRKQIKKMFAEGMDKKKILSFLKTENSASTDKPMKKIEIYYIDKTNVASRSVLDDKITIKIILEKITDPSISKIFLAHLQQEKYLKKDSKEKDSKEIEYDPALAFSTEGIQEMNQNIQQLNGGKPHKPIYSYRVYEIQGLKFPIGVEGLNAKKWVESAKGTNLFFAIYVDQEGKRSYATIPFNIVVERQKQGLPSVPEMMNESKLLFSLSPNELVYVPTVDEIENGIPLDLDDLTKLKGRIYKMVSSTQSRCFFIPSQISKSIIETEELGANNKSERSWDDLMIKGICHKIVLDRIGNIVKMY
jgi:CRISPR-associated endonuclease Csn1